MAALPSATARQTNSDQRREGTAAVKFKKAISFIQDTMDDTSEKKVDKKSLKKVLEKLDKHANKLEEKIKHEKDDKKLRKLEDKLKLNRAHAQKGAKIMAEID